MRVVVLGGAGVFGSRVVELLLRDGHEVVVAGRSVATKAAAHRFGVAALTIDRGAGLARLWDLSPDVVVDAAGPFHAYGDDPYRLAREAIAKRVHYLDLADDAAFCAGIAALDDAAQAAKVFVVSGLSSVPAISSATAVALAKDADAIDTIESAILPGNIAPRGRSVTESILHQCGTGFLMSCDGVPVSVRGWSQPAIYAISRTDSRPAWMIRVPDQDLFPKALRARTVVFRAGMELRVMNVALAGLSALRGWRMFSVPPWFVKLSLAVARLLAPFGTDTGGMVVKVTYARGLAWRQGTWRLFAKAGHGPFIPAVPVRAALRAPERIPFGARPAVGVISLAALEEAMADLDVTTDREDMPLVPLFPSFLQAGYGDLPATVQRLHDVPGPRIWNGRARVTRGGSLWSRLIAGLFGFPEAAEDMDVVVTKRPQNGGELWERRFAGKPFWSFLKVQGGRMTERFGPLTFTLDLHVADGRLHYPVVSGRAGPVPLPRWMLPVSIASEYEEGGRFHFDVRLLAPLTGALIVHYEGWLERASCLGDADQKCVQGPKGIEARGQL